MKKIHFTDRYLLNPRHPVTVFVIGAGGTGSQVITNLARMSMALQALGHPGLHVTVFDPDTVSQANIGRQLFSETELGLNKAVSLVTRINRFFGYAWTAEPQCFSTRNFSGESTANIIITCTDNIRSRLTLWKFLKKVRKENFSDHSAPIYWMDFGNSQTKGQVIIGTVREKVLQPSSQEYIPMPKMNVITEEVDYAKIKEKESSTFYGHVSPAANLCWYGVPGEKKENDVTKVEETWWYRFIHEHGFQLERNNSYSGSTVCHTGYEKADYSDRSFITRIHNLGTPDIILVFGGTNDSWAGAPIGAYQYDGWTKADLYSFRPAFCYLLASLKQLYPAARIYNITNSELSEEVTDSMDEICRHYGIENIRLHDIDKQWGHPSVQGMQSIDAQVWESVSPILEASVSLPAKN